MPKNPQSPVTLITSTPSPSPTKKAMHTYTREFWVVKHIKKSDFDVRKPTFKP